MADRLYCALNGTTLRDLDARIHLLDVEELAPAVRTVTASRIGGGLHLLRRLHPHGWSCPAATPTTCKTPNRCTPA